MSHDNDNGGDGNDDDLKKDFKHNREKDILYLLKDDVLKVFPFLAPAERDRYSYMRVCVMENSCTVAVADCKNNIVVGILMRLVLFVAVKICCGFNSTMTELRGRA